MKRIVLFLTLILTLAAPCWAQTPVVMSGDCTTTSTGVITCTKTNGGPIGITQTTLATDTNLGVSTSTYFSGEHKALILNTGASGNVNYTLPACVAQTSNPYLVTFYGIAAQTMTILPYSGDNFYLASTAYATSLVSGAARQTLIALGCFITGHWDLVGQNGAWTGN